jgi:serine/threonine-protein kinase
VAGAVGVAGADPKARRRRTTLLSIVAAVVVLAVAGLLWWQFPAGDRGSRGDRGGAQAAPGPVFSGDPTSAAPSATSPAARRSGRAQVQKPGAAATTIPPAADDQPPGGGAPRTTTPAAGGDDGDGDGNEEPEPTTTAPTTDPPAQERTFSSAAGSVRATCPSSSTAELLSWSATKPYKVNDVDQGPAASTAVVFKHGNRLVRMAVTCSGGVPSGSTDEG